MTDAERERALAEATATLSPRAQQRQRHYSSAAAEAADLDRLARELHLTRRQRAYAEGLAEGLSGLESARRAGYNGGDKGRSVAVAKMVGNPRIQTYLQALRSQRRDVALNRTLEHRVTRPRLLRRLWTQADADLGRYLVLDEQGSVTGFRVPRRKTRALRSVKLRERILRGPDGAEVLDRQTEFRVADPVPAAAKIADMMGWTQGGAEREGQTQAVAVQVNVLVGQAPPGALGGALDVLLGGEERLRREPA